MTAPGPNTLKRMKLVWLFWHDVMYDIRRQRELSGLEFIDQIIGEGEYLNALSASELLLFTLFIQEFFDDSHD